MDWSTLSWLAAFICGDDRNRAFAPIYRSKDALIAIFSSIDPTRFQYDGSSRHAWARHCLEECSEDELERIILYLASPKTYHNNPENIERAINSLNNALCVEGYFIELVGLTPEIKHMPPRLSRPLSLSKSENDADSTQLASERHSHEPLQFVDSHRIEELRTIKSTRFDLAKLIRFCEELNTCYSNECYLAVAMLTRALIDHVPTVFGFKTFAEVLNNYAATKSFREQIEHLQNSSRKVADSHLHTPIRDKETLPNQAQINFTSDVDVLLAEIVRILKREDKA